MKQSWKEVTFAVILGFVLPWGLCLLGAPVNWQTLNREEIQITVAQTEQAVQTIPVLMNGSVREMQLSEYLTGVILGELPGSFAFEAKKAQAVAARTYALRIAAGDRHGGAVCTDSGCCQSYRDPASVTSSEAVAQARDAVEQTRGMVLTYHGALIDATYFACSGGATEDAVAVWGADVPYLQSVKSPGEESAAYYTDSVTFSLEEFREALGVSLPADPAKWLGRVVYTAGGGVESMTLGGVAYAGTQLRRLLGLRSTAFRISVTGNSVTVTTKGFGHRVGMSQYGADAMARAGSDFAQILHHYYQGVTLEMGWE